MKKIRTLFERSSYDAKNKLNLSRKKVSEQILNEIETKGVTSERLETLDVPICKYKTQLTLHGIFPSISEKWLYGYKFIFQNKNKSIGVKWNAVDIEKKQRIFKYLREHGWNVVYNSTEYYATMSSKDFFTQDGGKKELTELQEKIKHIDTSLYYGDISVHLFNVYGVYRFIAFLYIKAIKETMVIPTIENILKNNIKELERIKEQKDNQRKIEREQYFRELEEKEKQTKEKRKPIESKLGEYFSQLGFRYEKNRKVEEGLLHVVICWLGDLDYRVVLNKYYKTPQQKKMRVYETYVGDLSDNLIKIILAKKGTSEMSWGGRVFHPSYVNGWVIHETLFERTFKRTK